MPERAFRIDETYDSDYAGDGTSRYAAYVSQATNGQETPDA